MLKGTVLMLAAVVFFSALLLLIRVVGQALPVVLVIVTRQVVMQVLVTSELRATMLREATFMGLPVVRTGRGYPEGFADPEPYSIAGLNLTSTKARLLLMACLMKFGALPVAAGLKHPTAAEVAATKAALAKYQQVFNTH